MNRLASISMSILGGLLGIACSPDGPAVQADASSAWEDGRSWEIGERPVVAIGALDGTDETEFEQVVGAFRTSEGRVTVVDAGALRISQFDSVGRTVWSAGRNGGGPGEFRSIRFADLYDGASDDPYILVYDFRQDRLSWFDIEGNLVGTQLIERGEGVNALNPVGILDEDVLLVAQWTGVWEGAEGAVIVDSVALVTYKIRPSDRGGDVARPLDTLVVVPHAERFFYRPPNFGTAIPYYVPFASSTVADASNDRWVYGFPRDRELRLGMDDGAADLTLPVGGRPIGDDETGEMKQRWSESMTDESGRSFGESARRWVDRFFEHAPMPASMPAFGSVVLDRDGNVWVGEYDPRNTTGSGTAWRVRPSAADVERPAPGITFHVFGRDGTYLGATPMPGSFVPLDIGDDYVLGIHRDEYDVESVLLYPLRKPHRE